jgi:hypothetical protein
MKSSYALVFTALLAAGALAACGGGGGSTAAPAGAPVLPPKSTGARVALAFTGTSSLSSSRRTFALAGTSVTVAYNGRIVGNGQLDSNGAAVIELEDGVPAGATVSVTAGTVTATFVLAHTMDDTAVLVQVHADGTLTVSVSSGTQPQSSPAPDDPNGSSETEDGHGNATSVDENDGGAALPANLPVSVRATCENVTLTPLSPAIASLRFEENVRDGDGGSKLKYEGPFTAAMTFPLIAQSARLRIRLFDTQQQQLLDVKAPLSAFGVSACASADPSASPSESPSPEPSETP